MTRNATWILKTINKSTNHMTAEELHMQLQADGHRMSLATVYNCLNKLTAEGSVRRIRIDGQPDRFDHTDKHDHLVCKKCGALADFRFSDLTSMLQSQSGEQIISYDLKVSYLCPACRRESAVISEQEPKMKA